ncbi:hypothetical protein GHT06_011644 [Daphnia sinensis]|uniref:EGF-like domain-containing protein n=1 Tax=Daphnia sinensis TaxID=1820382 RepID=A0AAD5KW37_9CRUS|nr:hypothetical protein GHT06_011644 [Daphnia sinensis]
MKLLCFWLLLFVQLSEFLTTGCTENEFRCETGERCVESQQRCDYVKDCEDGSDELDCETELTLLITTDQDVRNMSLLSNENRFIQTGLSQANGIAVDYTDNSVYWSEKSIDKGGIYKSMQNSEVEHVVSIGVETVQDLAIDSVGLHIYFTDSGRKHIVVCDLQGSLCSVVVSDELDKPHGVALYLKDALLFWSDCGTHPHIGSAGMDGSHRQSIITTDVALPITLAVDETAQRIFWSDAKLSRIESSNFDGSDRTIVPVEVTHPYALDVFADFIFWSDVAEHKILSADKLTGDDYKVILQEDSLNATAIHVHHRSRQARLSNPCMEAICSHLCLLSPSAKGYRCACPIGMTLNKDENICEQLSSPSPSIVIATLNEMYHLNHNQVGEDSIMQLSNTPGLKAIGALAFNPTSRSIIYSDTQNSIIYSMDLSSNHHEILFENVDMVEGLAVDPYTETIYWTERVQGKIVIGHENGGKYERLVLAWNLKNPKGIAVASEFGLMFVVEGSTSHIISLWQMDGIWLRNLVVVDGAISAMAYDSHDEHLYFSDSQRGTIERIDVDGANPTTFFSPSEKPIAMACSSDSVFWLSDLSARLSWVDKEDPTNAHSFLLDDVSHDNFDPYRLMTVINEFVLSRNHVCLNQTASCNGICVPTPREAKCLCSVGNVLSEDGSACDSVQCVGDQWFPCQSGCIPVKYRCDGVSHCSLGEDELDCNSLAIACSPNDPKCDCKSGCSICSEEEFQCDDGECIPLDFVCDDVVHCSDGTDEGGNCGTSCEDNSHCPHNCLSGPKEPICQCEPGYDSLNDGRNCIDIDECKAHFSCSQLCNNTEGHYDCLCIPGYSLDQDKHTCKTINGRPLMVAASAHHITMLIDDNVISSQRQFEWHEPIKGVAFHDKTSTLYWITNAGVIRSNNLGQSLVYKFTSLKPTGLALESTTGNLYVSAVLELNGEVQQERSIIKVVSHSLESDVNIVHTQTKITAIAIDSVRGILFWSDEYGSSAGRIVSSALNGKSTHELCDTQVFISPVALAVDPIKSRIYWADSKQQSILSCTYNGQDQRKHVSTNGKPLSVTFFENRISWTVLHQDIIYSRQVAGEPMEKSLQLPETKAVEHLFTTHSILEPEYPNPCASSPCGNGLCVLKNVSSFSCFCPGDESVISIAPFRCSSRCARGFFHCHPNSECISRSLVCINDANCETLSDRKLCEKLKDILKSGESVLTSSLTRGILHSLSVISLLESNGTDRWIQDTTRNESLPYLETRMISGQSPSNQSRRKVIFSRHIEIRDEVYVPDEYGADQQTAQEIESTLQAILGGPVYVRSCLFTKKGHYIDLATMLDRQGKPVPINQVWDVSNQTRFVEDIEVSDGSRMILWKIFRPQAYTADSKLRAVDQMELRTLQKMGYCPIDVDLATWNRLTESDRITFLNKKLGS